MSVTVSGPLFDGRIDVLIGDLLTEASEAVSEDAVNTVKRLLGSSLQNPTGRYERGIQTERQQDDISVNDSGIVYGPWLEGVSSRNQTTRFKGYSSFRRATQDVNDRALTVIEGSVRAYVARMG